MIIIITFFSDIFKQNAINIKTFKILFIMKRSLKIILWISAALLLFFIAVFSSFLIITADARLDPKKLTECGKTITILDSEGNKIEDASLITKRGSVSVSELNAHTVNAFIASEDRTFYRHSGVNYKRMLKALYKNLTSRSFKEGASTISQQLIKNTHLNNDKTITRKLKEIKLSKQLEKRYSKDEILEMYLNTIYFGHNCYGLESAAQFYFQLPAEKLSLEQSATIVGLLTSPNNFSPFKNPDKCISRRNIVLKNMLDCGYIDEQTYKESVNLPLSATENKNQNGYSSYLSAVFSEFEECGLDPYGNYNGLTVQTYLDKEIQNAADGLAFEYDGAVVVRNSDGGISAYRTTCGSAKRQIGSTAKPIFVYAPAIEENKLQLFTKINDEPINFNCYAPENYDKKYRGYVSVEDAITQSLNVPAVKTMNALTPAQAAVYAKKMGVGLSEEDKNLSLALGSMSSGMTIKELCDCYSVFGAGGNFTQSKFIKSISDEYGNLLYENKRKESKVFSQGTCSLMNDVLCKATKSGTAKKLKNFQFDVACKTGTCGTKEGNTDAYAMFYTSRHCIGIWAGDKDNKKLDITGGNYCCRQAEQLLNKMYGGKNVPPLEKESGTAHIELDREEYEQNNKILLCDGVCPLLNRLQVKCAEQNIPIEKSQRFSKPSISKPTISVNNNAICIKLCQTKYYAYLVKRKNNGSFDIIYDDKWKAEICDILDDGEYVYTVTPYYRYDNKNYYGEEIVLPKIIVSKNKGNDGIPDIAKKDWFNDKF